MKTEEQIRLRLESLKANLNRVEDLPSLWALYLRDIDLLEWVLER